MKLLTIPQVVEKSASMAETDPHGIIITIVSVSVVFAVLLALLIAYTLVGKIISAADRKKASSDKETKVRQDKGIHDKESYMITIGKQSVTANRAPVITNLNPDLGEQSILAPEVSKSDKSLKAPLPGVITSIKVNAGDKVKAGQVLATLEAMKMENDLEAEYDGIVKAINIQKGESALEGATIITIA